MIFVFLSRENLSVFAVPLVCCTSYDLSSNKSCLTDYWHVDFYQETYWRTSQYGRVRRCIPLTVSFSLSPPLTSGFRFCSFFRFHRKVSNTTEFVMSAKTLTKEAGPDDVLLGREAVTKTTEKLWIRSKRIKPQIWLLNNDSFYCHWFLDSPGCWSF